MRIRIGHTPDADDAFMFYGINQGLVDLQGLEIEHCLLPMQDLNQRALRGELEMTAFSFACFAQARQHYWALPTGWSLGQATGPQIVAAPGIGAREIRAGSLASPGSLTTAHWLARLWHPQQDLRECAFDRVLQADATGAILIYEGMMSLAEQGLVLVEDLGRWWYEATGLPIPLGLNGLRRDLPPEVAEQLSRALSQSIALALEQVEPALDQALPLARGLDRQRCREFVLRYVNDKTLRPGSQGLLAAQEFYDRAYRAGLLSQPLTFAQELWGKTEPFSPAG